MTIQALLTSKLRGNFVWLFQNVWTLSKAFRSIPNSPGWWSKVVTIELLITFIYYNSLKMEGCVISNAYVPLNAISWCGLGIRLRTWQKVYVILSVNSRCGTTYIHTKKKHQHHCHINTLISKVTIYSIIS